MLIIRRILQILLLLFIISLIAISFITHKIWKNLPSSEEIAQISCIEPVQVFTQDGVLLGEIGTTKRYPQNIEDCPPLLQSAFIAVEDIRFYQHKGVDIKALARALVAVVAAKRKVQGGSTITMQVARNFYLKRQKTFLRKYKEILLAIKMETLLDKNKILELYLNKIFLGHNCYGVEAAARTYFGKSIQQLSLSEIAVIAGLPKAPSVLNPLTNINNAKKRRDIVLAKMLEYKFISEKEFNQASEEDVLSRYFPRKIELPAPHIVALVKKSLPSHILKTGAKVFTTIDSKIQREAQEALDIGLEQYDRRHSYRGPVGNIENGDLPPKGFSKSAPIMPVVLTEYVNNNQIIVKPSQGPEREITLDTNSLKFVRFRKEHSNHLLPYEKDFSRFSKGDILFITKKGHFITQVPIVTGATVTLNRKGEILALVNGLSYNPNHVNRSLQTRRQIGSTFKPLIYAYALDNGYDVDTLIQDSAMIYEDKNGKKWTPQNDNQDYLGSISFEKSFIHSRNLSTLSLGQNIPIQDLLKKISTVINRSVSMNYTTLLGTIELAPLELATLYCAFINDGTITSLPVILKKEDNYFLEKEGRKPVEIDFFSKQANYIMKDLMKEAFKHYGFQAHHWQGGKTGTTNEKQDLWFAGYKQDLVSVVWMGFDKPAPLYEYASKNSALIWNRGLKNINRKYEEEIPDNIIFKLGRGNRQTPYVRK